MWRAIPHAAGYVVTRALDRTTDISEAVTALTTREHDVMGSFKRLIIAQSNQSPVRAAGPLAIAARAKDLTIFQGQRRAKAIVAD